MSDTTTLSSRSAIAGLIIDLQQELDRLHSDLFHVHAVLRLFGLLPEDIPTKGRIPKRSTYFGRNEITRRCYDMLRERETVCANDIAERAMRDNGLDPKADRRQRLDFVKRYHNDCAHLGDFVMAYNFAKRLKTLKGLTPYEYVCKIWTAKPERSRLDPIYQMPGLNT